MDKIKAVRYPTEILKYPPSQPISQMSTYSNNGKCNNGNQPIHHVRRTSVPDGCSSERNQEPWDRGVYESVGIDPARQRYLLLKSRMYFRPVFLPIAKGMVFCDAPGVSSSDWTEFEYRKLRRPIYPLDENFANGRAAAAA